jgi:hypothetical protein
MVDYSKQSYRGLRKLYVERLGKEGLPRSKAGIIALLESADRSERKALAQSPAFLGAEFIRNAARVGEENMIEYLRRRVRSNA